MADTDLDDLTEISDAANVGNTHEVVAQPAGAVAPVRVPISVLKTVIDSLPDGSASRNTVRYVNGAWSAVSTERIIYGAWTRGDTFTSLKTLFDDVAGEPGGIGANADGLVFEVTGQQLILTNGSGSSSIVAALDDIWPQGGSAPYMWILSPQYYSWLLDIKGNIAERTKTPGAVSSNPVDLEDITMVEQSYSVAIDGVPYDVGLLQCPAVRPTDPISWLIFWFALVPPAQPIRTFAQI